MILEYIPLLQIQRDLYTIPRGQERFRTYLSAMTNSETGDLELPLAGMNPMGKDHVPTLLDQYLALDADGAAAKAVAGAAHSLRPLERAFKVGLVMTDDAGGGWTDRYTTEFSHRFETKPLFRRGWLPGVLWTSEEASVETACQEALSAVYRGAFVQQHGWARTLGEMLAQEGWVMAMVGCTGRTLDADDLDYTREIIKPYLETHDHPTIMACLFGDVAAQSLGYQPYGLSHRAGFALALDESREMAHR
ncbi:MAG: hypothetical protein M3Y56_02930 [Armatimonadota bacterium]|nr:hypothetical protein [Armatimonadota bacterium]